MANKLGINEKSKIGQFFCKHHNTEWFVKKSKTFQSISGEKRVLICKDCGKVVGDFFARYEGAGFK